MGVKMMRDLENDSPVGEVQAKSFANCWQCTGETGIDHGATDRCYPAATSAFAAVGLDSHE
jgi:hypothetical protein